jgi:hypothetical protein
MLSTKNMAHTVKNPGQLSDAEIKTILDNWDVPDWNDMQGLWENTAGTCG